MKDGIVFTTHGIASRLPVTGPGTSWLIAAKGYNPCPTGYLWKGFNGVQNRIYVEHGGYHVVELDSAGREMDLGYIDIKTADDITEWLNG